MTATNHALTGAAIGFIVGQPILAIPLAIASHFICDALPHFDRPDGVTADAWLRSSTFKRILVADGIGCLILVVYIFSHHPIHWLLACICAFAATSPDLLWLNRYLNINKHHRWHPSAFAKFAGSVQWFAKPIGGVVEIAWFSASLLILLTFLR